MPVAAGTRFLDIVENLGIHVHRLLADLEDPSKSATDWDGPAIGAVGVPIRGHDRCGDEVPTAVEVVVNDGCHVSHCDLTKG